MMALPLPSSIIVRVATYLPTCLLPTVLEEEFWRVSIAAEWILANFWLTSGYLLVRVSGTFLFIFWQNNPWSAVLAFSHLTRT